MIIHVEIWEPHPMIDKDETPGYGLRDTRLRTAASNLKLPPTPQVKWIQNQSHRIAVKGKSIKYFICFSSIDESVLTQILHLKYNIMPKN
jgi:hypothetical protein